MSWGGCQPRLSDCRNTAAAGAVKACMKLVLPPESTKQMESAVSSVVLWFDQTDPINVTPEQCEFVARAAGQGGKKKKKRQGLAQSYTIFCYSTWISTWEKLEIYIYDV